MKHVPAHDRAAQELLFESPAERSAARLAFEARIREFAEAVARRHTRGRTDPAGLAAALRGYYAALALFAPLPVPPLDDATLSLALETYLLVKSGGRALAA